jgi:hypothetical protein
MATLDPLVPLVKDESRQSPRRMRNILKIDSPNLKIDFSEKLTKPPLKIGDPLCYKGRSKIKGGVCA